MATRYRSKPVEDIVERWIAFIDGAKHKTNRPMMVRLLFLASGAWFTDDDIERIKAFVATLDATKDEVKEVVKWVNSIGTMQGENTSTE